MSAQVTFGGTDGQWSAPIPLASTPMAIPNTSRILLGYDGSTLVYLDLAGASIGWTASLAEAIADVVRQEPPAGPVPLRALRGVPHYRPEVTS